MEHLEINSGNYTDDLSMLEELRNTYDQIHHQIDQLFSVNAIQLILYPDQIKVQNQKVAARLQYLEQGYLTLQSETNNISYQFNTSSYTESKYNPIINAKRRQPGIISFPHTKKKTLKIRT